MSEPHPSDEIRTCALVVAARSGDPDSWDELFARATPRLRAYLHLRLGAALSREADVDDLVQETYLAASASLDDFEPRRPGAFVAWLCCIGDHRIARLAEHHGAAKRRPPEVRQRLTRALARLTSGQTGPATVAAAQDHAEALRKAVAALDSEARAAVLMRYFEARTIDEIALAQQRSATAVRRLLGRAMRELGGILGSEGSP